MLEIRVESWKSFNKKDETIGKEFHAACIIGVLIVSLSYLTCLLILNIFPKTISTIKFIGRFAGTIFLFMSVSAKAGWEIETIDGRQLMK